MLIGNNPGDNALGGAGGDVGNDTLVGGAGNDVLDGGRGDDSMVGGTGNDHYLETPNSADVLDENSGSDSGIDTIDYTYAFFGITFSLGKPGEAQIVNDSYVHTVMTIGTFENLTGSTFDDRLSGSAGSNLLLGGGGNDILYGGELLDTLSGFLGDGNDTLVGGQGSNTLLGGTGNDPQYGGELLVSLPGVLGPPPAPVPNTSTNLLIGGTGNDTLIGGAGNDLQYGGELLAALPGLPPPPPSYFIGTQPDNNVLIGGGGSDTLLGGAGNDLQYGGELLVALPGFTAPIGTSTTPDGINVMIGGLGADTLIGGSNNDLQYGGELFIALPGLPPPPPFTPPPIDLSPNTLIGGLGNDTLLGGAGNDLQYGGELLTAFSTITAVPTGVASIESNTIIGGLGSDTLVGAAGNDLQYGGELFISVPGITYPTMTPQIDLSPNTLVGGLGNDTLLGGAGNDLQYGGELLSTFSTITPITTTAAALESNTLIGGLGADTLIGAAGNDLQYGGELLLTLPGLTFPVTPVMPDTSPNTLIGGFGNDTLIGGAGNDLQYGGELFVGLASASLLGTTTAPDDDTMIGGLGTDTLLGGTGNDLIYGGELLLSLPGTIAPPPSVLPDLGNSLFGGAGNDTLLGAAGNDLQFGGEGDDWLSGGAGEDLFEGGSGIDAILETIDAHVTLTATTLLIGPSQERFYDIERARIAGGDGPNRFDASAFVGPVTLLGGNGNDTLIGSAFADSLIGGAGDDSLLGLAGGDVLDTGSGTDFADGGAGNDQYVLALSGFQTLTDISGIDSIDLSAAAFAIEAGLATGSIKFTHLSTDIAELLGSFENLRGTSYDDWLRGSAEPNILEGGGGLDRIDGDDGADILQASFPQIIWLDFDTGTGPNEHVYTIDERNRIQERLEKAFGAPFSISFTQTTPSVGRFSRMTFNAGESEALVAGAVDELDWRNASAGSQAYVNVNGFLGRKGQPAASSENYIALSANIAIHEIGHTLGLRHTDAFGPIGSGVYAPAAIRTAVDQPLDAIGLSSQAALFALRAPVLTAPSGLMPYVAPYGTVFVGGAAVATFVYQGGDFTVTPIGAPTQPVTDVQLDAASGALIVLWSQRPPGTPSIRATYQYDAFRPGLRGAANAYETPRSYLASPASTGTSVADTLQADSFGVRGLIKIAFADSSSSVRESNLGGAQSAVFPSARALPLAPLAVPNLLPAGYLQAGQQLQVRAANVLGTLAAGGTDIYAFTGRAGDVLAAEIYSTTIPSRIADPFDSKIRVYDAAGTLIAENDDAFGGTDSILFDVPLANEGTYFITVQGFNASESGSYELFAYTAATPGSVRLGGAGDTLSGGAGSDVLIGGAGDDQFDGDLSEDIFIGFVPDADGEYVPNAPPTVTVTLVPAAPFTNDTVTATITAEDPEGDELSFTYEWRVNGIVVPQATGPTFDLSQAGNRGNEIRVNVTARDGSNPAVPATAAVVVANSVPAALPASFETDEEELLFDAVFVDDADAGDDHTFALVTAPAVGAFSLNANGTFTYTPPVDFQGSVTFTFTANDGAAVSNVATATIVVRPLNDAPLIARDTAAITVVEGGTATNSGTFSDPDGDSVTLAASIGAVVDLGNGRWSWSWLAADGPDARTVTVTASDPYGRASTVSFTLDVANAAPTADFTVTGASYGQVATARFTNARDASPVDEADGFRYAFALSAAALETAPITTDGTAEFAGLSAGSYTVYARIFDKDGGATDASAPFTITQATAAVSVNGHTSVYDGLAHGLTGTAFGARGENLTTLLNLGAARTDAGTTEVGWTFAGDANHAAASGTASIVIDRAPLTIRADDASRVYGASNPGFTAAYSGFVNGEGSGVLGGSLTLTTSADEASPVGGYAIIPSGVSSDNYAITFANGTLTITQATAAVSVNGHTGVYDGLAHGLTGTAFGARGENLTTLLNLGASQTNAGVTVVNWTFAGDANHAPAAGTVSIVIDRAPLTIRADDVSRVYGSANPGFTTMYSGFVNGEGSGVLGGSLAITTSASEASPVGGYAIEPSGVSSDNYAITFANGTLTITQAVATVSVNGHTSVYDGLAHGLTGTAFGVRGENLTTLLNLGTTQTDAGTTVVNWTFAGDANHAAAAGTASIVIDRAPLTIRANDASRVYGASNPGFTAGYSGFVNGEGSGVLGGSLAITTSASEASPVGGYAIEPSGVSSDNYAITFANGTLTITQAVATVSVNGHTSVYDGLAHGLTGTAFGVRGENLTTLLNLGTTQTDAGTTVVNWTFAGDANHAAAAGTASIVIDRAPLTIRADDASRVYGASNPGFTATYSGFVNGEGAGVLGGSLAITTSADEASPVGAYAIEPSGMTSTNYAITFANGILTITQASLTFTVNDATRAEGDANPSFSGSFSGLLNGDAISVAFNTSATASSPSGTYAITATLSGAALANYTATVVPGTLTVTPAAGGPVQFTGGNLAVSGGSGADAIQLFALSGGVGVSINGVNYGPFAVTGSIVVDGGEGDDAIAVGDGFTRSVTLLGGAGNDTLRGGGGSDSLEGGTGDDSLVATAGNDTLQGGTGNDTLRAGSGNDILFGGDGDDSLQAAIGDDTLYGEAGNDTLRAGSGNDLLRGGDGNDSLVALSGNDTLFGDAGDDTLRAGSGNDIVFGGDGNDSIHGASGCDTLDGGAGNDTIRAGSGVDVVFGGDGDDSLFGGSGLDTLDGGAGNDTIVAGSGVDLLIGGAGNDSLLGGSGRDTLLGNDGHDTLFGGAGDDFLDGGTGNDDLDGDAGSDILLGGDGDDMLIGGSGNDFLIGGFGSDHLFGNAAEDILVAGYTAHDSNAATLTSILNTWNGSGTYQARVAALSGVLKTGANATVFDDNAADQLTGNAGTDWFFANVSGGGVLDCITDLGNKESTGDT